MRLTNEKDEQIKSLTRQMQQMKSDLIKEREDSKNLTNQNEHFRKDLNRLKNENDKFTQQMDQMRKNLVKDNEDLSSQLKRQRLAKEQIIAELKAELETDLNALQFTIGKQKTEIKNLKKTVQERDSTILSLKEYKQQFSHTDQPKDKNFSNKYEDNYSQNRNSSVYPQRQPQDKMQFKEISKSNSSNLAQYTPKGQE